MMSRVLTAVMIAALASFASSSAVGMEQLTLTHCIETALKNHPAVKAADGQVAAASGRVTQAASPYYPRLQASTGYTESHSKGISSAGTPTFGGGLTTSGAAIPTFGESTTKGYTTTLTLSQLLYDFGRTGNTLGASDAALRATEFDRARTIQETVLNVKEAYFSLLRNEKLLIVAQRTVEQAESRLKQAEAFFRAGTRPRFDVTSAEVEVNNAKLGLITATNNVRLSAISLNNAMGTEPGAAIAVEDVMAAQAAVPSVEIAQQEALRNRPEMLKSAAESEALRERLKAEQAGHFPSLSASGSYNWANGTAEAGGFQGDLGDSWNVGVTLTLPLFEGGLTRGKVKEARANLLIAEAQHDSLKQSILLDVNRAYADYESARARVEVMEASQKKAQENLALAQGRYEAGVGPFIEVTDARVSTVKAETDYVQAKYDYHLAVARLGKAMGQ